MDFSSPLRRYKNLRNFFRFIFQNLPYLAYLIYTRFSFFLKFILQYIYKVTNPIIDVYEVDIGRHYQSQSLTFIWFTTRLTFINPSSSEKITQILK